jgi:hypothetical protein
MEHIMSVCVCVFVYINIYMYYMEYFSEYVPIEEHILSVFVCVCVRCVCVCVCVCVCYMEYVSEYVLVHDIHWHKFCKVLRIMTFT